MHLEKYIVAFGHTNRKASFILELPDGKNSPSNDRREKVDAIFAGTLKVARKR